MHAPVMRLRVPCARAARGPLKRRETKKNVFAQALARPPPLFFFGPLHPPPPGKTAMWAASRRRAAALAVRAGRPPLGAAPASLPGSLPAPSPAQLQPLRRANVVGMLVRGAQIYRALQGQQTCVFFVREGERAMGRTDPGVVSAWRGLPDGGVGPAGVGACVFFAGLSPPSPHLTPILPSFTEPTPALAATPPGARPNRNPHGVAHTWIRVGCLSLEATSSLEE